ncbi:MAG: Nuclease [Chitinophagaceae bacterium]|nr:Nuclease [Chitinophagaceae bacterium]
MKRKISIAFITLILITGSITLLYAWGSWGHKHINRSAVFALPEEMRIFYYDHIDFITEGAVVPDLRRALLNDKAEPARHFIDIEDFGVKADALPRTVKDAYAKYDSAFLQKSGYLPWYMQSLMDRLTLAFSRKNKSEIIFLSAELGHYMGDAHVPLHTSSNYDGQLTNQKGIHSFWESRLPETFGGTYNFYTGDAKYIDDIISEIWRIIKQSHLAADTVLAAEKQLRANFPKDDLYKKDSAGKPLMRFNQPVLSDAYAAKYHEVLNGMVERQMRLAAIDLSNFWYTAWVNGGKPNLTDMDDPDLVKQNKKSYKRELKAWQKGRLVNLKTAEKE